MWSSVSIPGIPRILTIDVTGEYAFSDRVHHSLKKSGLEIEGNRPMHAVPNRLNDHQFNCLLMFARSPKDVFETIVPLSPSPYLLAICSTDGFDLKTGESILKSDPRIAPIVIAPLSTMSLREAGLFYLKFFTELKLHSTENITGKMVWFSVSKAKELLKRRRYTAKFGVLC